MAWELNGKIHRDVNGINGPVSESLGRSTNSSVQIYGVWGEVKRTVNRVNWANQYNCSRTSGGGAMNGFVGFSVGEKWRVWRLGGSVS